MKLNRINSITPCVSFRAQKNQIKHNNSAPVKAGLTTAGVWFGFGVGLDLLSRKCHFSKSPFKNSLAINGIIGGAAGIFTAIKGCKQDSSEE